MATIDQALQAIGGFVWGPYMLMLLVGTGVILTVLLRFVNVTRLFLAFKLLFGHQFAVVDLLKPVLERHRNYDVLERFDTRSQTS